MSEEVKLKQAEDCFLRLPLPPLSRDPAGQCFAPGYNLSGKAEDTVHLQQKVVSVQMLK